MCSLPLHLLILFCAQLLIIFCSASSNLRQTTLDEASESRNKLPPFYLPNHLPSTIHVNKLYHLTSSFRLIGSDRNISLTANNSHSFRLGHAHLKILREYELAVARDGTVLGVEGPGLHLEPIDLIKFPGLFVNTLRKSKLSPTVDIPSESRQASSQCTKISSLRVAVAFSHRLCRQFGSYSSTVDAVQLAFDAASQPFETQTCLQLKVVFIDGYCRPIGDPYRTYSWRFSGSRRRQGKLLPVFRSHWIKRRKNIKRDLTIFIQVFSSWNPIAGSAYIGTGCLKWNAFGWAEGLNGAIIAHEIGHIMNAYHDTHGIMTAVIDPIVEKRMRFSKRSAQQIKVYSRNSRCPTKANLS